MYAECVERTVTVDDSWVAVPEKNKWDSLDSTAHSPAGVKLWCVDRRRPFLQKARIGRSQSVSLQIKREFDQLASLWKRDTAFKSSDTDIVLHPAYQRIMAMGERALPLILRELSGSGGNWYWALRHITGVNPVSREDVGRTKKMKEAWLTWGREHHYL